MPDWQTDHKLQQYNIMAILSKGTTFSSGQSVTAANLNALVDSANFVAGASGTTDNTTLQVHSSGYLEVKDDGITNAKLADDAVNASSIADGTITDTQLANDAVTTPKIKDSTGATDGVTTAKIATGAVTAAKISTTDTTFNVGTNVGIGAVASSSFKLNVTGGASIANFQSNSPGSSSAIFIRNTSSTGNAAILQLISRTGGTNLARSLDINLDAVNGFLQFSFAEGDQCAIRFDNSNVGDLNAGTGALFPKTNGTQDIGKTGTRWNNLWSAGTFNGSDRNLKEDIEELDEAEKRVAIACKSLVKKYRLKSAIEKKGDDARTHIGIIAQELQAAFEAEGLNAFKYSMIGKDTWWEKIEDGERVVKYEATEGYTEVTQMSVQYTELLAFIITAL